MKRDSVNVYTNMKHDTPFPYMQLYALWMTHHSPTNWIRTQLMPPFSTKKHIKRFEYHIH